MSSVSLLPPLLLQQRPVDRADGLVDLLQVSFVMALTVAAAVAISFALRPLLRQAPSTEGRAATPGAPPAGAAEPGAGGTVGPPGRPTILPFPSTDRDLLEGVDERMYRDPVIAARLRQVLSGSRRHRRQPDEPPAWLPGPWPPRQPTPGPWLAGGDERPTVGHTSPTPSTPPADPLAGSDQEPTRMPTSDSGQAPADLPPPLVGQGRSSGREETAPAANVVPFAPRPFRSDPQEVDGTTLAALSATVRELLFCANVGEYLHGFALYSDRYLFRFMDDTGMTVDEFRQAFEAAPGRDPNDWVRLSHLSDARRLPDGRITAVATYEDGERPGASERYTFEFGADRGLWLIDDIEQL